MLSHTDVLLLLHRDEAGQGLVEYLLIFAIVCFSAVAGMGVLATTINSAFTAMSLVFGQYIS
jgi:Flp pilus assembly pilin Flp